jgi:hypothetical protein
MNFPSKEERSNNAKIVINPLASLCENINVNGASRQYVHNAETIK